MAGGFRFTLNDAKIKEELRHTIAALDRADEAMTHAHKRLVTWLGERSADNLDKARRRHGDPRNGEGLGAALRDPNASAWDAHGFEFLIDSRVQAINARIAAYYRVIEGRPGSNVGSRYWVNRTATRPLFMTFLGFPARPDARATPVQAGVGGFRLAPGPGGKKVVFTNPIPAYHYVLMAREAFIKGNLYYKWAYEELRRVGIPVVTRSRPGG